MTEKFGGGPFGNLGPKIKEETVPIKNLVESFEKLYYLTSGVTRESTFARTADQPEGKKRPFFLRSRRARMYEDIKNGGEKEEILKEARLLDNISEQYLNQNEVTVTLPGYGEQKSRVVDIAPPESLVSQEMKNKPPIFIIPGISNDIDCISNLLAQVALEGRRVITAGYPESFMGETTNEFAEGVKNDPGFQPHIEFFKGVIDTVLKKGEEVELWGYSTDGPIVSGILKDAKYQEKTKNAVLLFPAASVDQGVNNLKLGAVRDLGAIKKNFQRFAAFSWGISKISKEKQQVHDKIMGALLERVSRKNEDWKDARVQEGGNIIVISGGKDEITKSASMHEVFEKGNSQIKTVTLPEAYHSAEQTEPEEVVDAIFKLQNKEK